MRDTKPIMMAEIRKNTPSDRLKTGMANIQVTHVQTRLESLNPPFRLSKCIPRRPWNGGIIWLSMVGGVHLDKILHVSGSTSQMAKEMGSNHVVKLSSPHDFKHVVLSHRSPSGRDRWGGTIPEMKSMISPIKHVGTMGKHVGAMPYTYHRMIWGIAQNVKVAKIGRPRAVEITLIKR